MMNRFVVASMLLVLSSARASASLDPADAITQYVQANWRTQSGLPENSVMAIAQTRDGYLWLGTESGLVRFDGTSFVTFDKLNTPLLKAGSVTALFTDRSGVLWIGTASGDVVRFVDGVFEPGEGRDASNRRDHNLLSGLPGPNLDWDGRRRRSVR